MSSSSSGDASRSGGGGLRCNENAGFSRRANPYYIVQQGKVSALCVARDEDRLALLKEVGGAGVYEAKRAEAAKTLDETSAKRESIKGVLRPLIARFARARGRKGGTPEVREIRSGT